MPGPPTCNDWCRAGSICGRCVSNCVGMDSAVGEVAYREATLADVPEMVRCRVGDPAIGPADPRMALYLEGKHHPQRALAPRVMFVCLEEDTQSDTSEGT